MGHRLDRIGVAAAGRVKPQKAEDGIGAQAQARPFGGVQMRNAVPAEEVVVDHLAANTAPGGEGGGLARRADGRQKIGPAQPYPFGPEGQGFAEPSAEPGMEAQARGGRGRSGVGHRQADGQAFRIERQPLVGVEGKGPVRVLGAGGPVAQGQMAGPRVRFGDVPGPAPTDAVQAVRRGWTVDVQGMVDPSESEPAAGDAVGVGDHGIGRSRRPTQDRPTRPVERADRATGGRQDRRRPVARGDENPPGQARAQ